MARGGKAERKGGIDLEPKTGIIPVPDKNAKAFQALLEDLFQPGATL